MTPLERAEAAWRFARDEEADLYEETGGDVRLATSPLFRRAYRRVADAWEVAADAYGDLGTDWGDWSRRTAQARADAILASLRHAYRPEFSDTQHARRRARKQTARC